jgi:DNA-directed RNA polymerase subunit RPC12/RpoP
MTERTYNYNYLECPYCGYKDRDTGEIFDEIEECIDEYQCSNCGEIFTATKSALFAYEGLPIIDGANPSQP